MPELVVNGCTIHYDEFGVGVPVVVTPGGRWAGYVQRVIAAELAKDSASLPGTAATRTATLTL